MRALPQAFPGSPNHRDKAIETHSKNYPGARHYASDVDAVKPAPLVPEGQPDLLMASPTCTYQSRARVRRPINDRGDRPLGDLALVTEPRIKRLLVEHVPEFREWGPLDPRTGRPI